VLITAAQIPPSEGLSLEFDTFDFAVILAVLADVFVRLDLIAVEVLSET
jgi:hypothetical protein